MSTVNLAAVTPDYDADVHAYGAYATSRYYVRQNAAAALAAVGVNVPAEVVPTLAVRLDQAVDLDPTCPVTDWSPGVSWAVIAEGYRDRLPDDWTVDADAYSPDGRPTVPTLDAATVVRIHRGWVESYDTDAARVAVRALSLSGARGVHSVALCSHSGEWLSWSSLADERGHLASDAADDVSDALVWVPREVVESDFRADGEPVFYHARRAAYLTYHGRDVSAEVEAWAAERVAAEVGTVDQYVRGDVYGVVAQVTTDADPEHLDDLRSWAECIDFDGESAVWGFYGDDADPTSEEGHGAAEVLGDAWYEIEVAAGRAAAAERSRIEGGVWVI